MMWLCKSDVDVRTQALEAGTLWLGFKMSPLGQCHRWDVRSGNIEDSCCLAGELSHPSVSLGNIAVPWWHCSVTAIVCTSETIACLLSVCEWLLCSSLTNRGILQSVCLCRRLACMCNSHDASHLMRLWCLESRSSQCLLIYVNPKLYLSVDIAQTWFAEKPPNIDWRSVLSSGELFCMYIRKTWLLIHKSHKKSTNKLQ